jgi:multidrug resistance efflux pump
VPEWQAIADTWQDAIDLLEQVPLEDPGFDEAQRMLAEYKSNLRTIEIRLADEQASTEAWQAAQDHYTRLWGSSQQLSSAQYAEELQLIVNDLQRVKEGSSPFEDAQTLLASVQAQLAEYAEQ